MFYIYIGSAELTQRQVDKAVAITSWATEAGKSIRNPLPLIKIVGTDAFLLIKPITFVTMESNKHEFWAICLLSFYSCLFLELVNITLNREIN